MHSYFFHLSFELYSTPPPSVFASRQFAKPYDTFLPPSSFDIFTESLPVHKTLSWSSPQASNRAHKRSKTASSNTEFSEPSAVGARPTYQRRLSHLSPGDRTHRPVPLTSGKKLDSEIVYKRPVLDWRFDSIVIQSIDMAPEINDGIPANRGKSVSDISRVVVNSGWATKGRFVPGDPKNTNIGWGVVRLYRDGQETPELHDELPSNSSSDNAGAGTLAKSDFDEGACGTLCILAVPSYMTPSDFLGWVGEQTREEVSNFRLIRTGSANKYMVLMKFRDAKKARQWRQEWNGRLFNSMEPENCHVVFVKSIHFPASRQDPSSFPANTNDPFTPASGPNATTSTPTAASTENNSLAQGLTPKPLPPPTPNLVELPTCPVCLERMDETTGLLAIMCQHVFHCACLEKWRGSGCPVCRYTQNDALSGRGFRNDEGDSPENECSVCGATANLWICLICGNIGCGRYDSAHAFAHWESTSHSYAMDIATQHVWDYAGDGYVHRLIQNKADGKLVDLPAAYSRSKPSANPNGNFTAFGEDTVPRDKLDNMAVEYTYLLTHQLESQRTYYEETVQRAADKAAKASADADQAASAVADLAVQLETLQEKLALAQASITTLERDLARQTQKATTTTEIARKLTKQYQEEKAINDALSRKITYLEESNGNKEEVLKRANEKLKTEVADLTEQVQDLNFFISGTQKMEEVRKELGDDELEGALLEVGESSHGKGRKKKGKR